MHKCFSNRRVAMECSQIQSLSGYGLLLDILCISTTWWLFAHGEDTATPYTKENRQSITLDCIVLSVQINLISIRYIPHCPLQLRNCITDINPHARRSADEHTCPASSPFFAHLPEHERNVWPAIFSAPASFSRFDGSWQKSKSHEVLLELCRRGGKTKVKVTLRWRSFLKMGCCGWVR